MRHLRYGSSVRTKLSSKSSRGRSEEFKEKNLKIIDIDGVAHHFPMTAGGSCEHPIPSPFSSLRYEAETLDRLGEIRDLIESMIERIKGDYS